MENNPALKPKVLAGRKQAGAGKVRRSSHRVNRTKGKNKSFRCSHTDSLTGEKRAAAGIFPDHSYRKCRSVPKTAVNIKPQISNFIFFPNIFPPLTERHKDGFLPFFLYKKYIQIMLKIFLCRKVTIKSPIWV